MKCHFDRFMSFFFRWKCDGAKHQSLPHVPDKIEETLVEGELSIASETSVTVTLKLHTSATDHVLEVVKSEKFDWHAAVYAGDELQFCGYEKCDEKREAAITSLVVVSGPSANELTIENPKNIFLKPIEAIEIGMRNGKVMEVSCWTHTILSNLRANLGDYLITIESLEKPDMLGKHLGGNHGMSKITLKGKENCLAVYDQHMKEALDFLCVMYSGLIKYHKKQYIFNDRSSLDVYEFSSGYLSRDSCTVLYQDCFIEQTYSCWKGLDKDMRTQITIASQYLGLSVDEVYLDSQLFMVNQAWEVFSKAYKRSVLKADVRYQEACSKRNAEMQRLSQIIENEYNKWLDDQKEGECNEIYDIKSLVTSARNITLKSAVDDLVKDLKLNMDAIGFDSSSLIKNSDTVRHTGKLRDKFEPDDVFDLFQNSKMALELVFFRYLGYSGKIRDSRGEVKKILSIGDYFYD